MVSVQSTTVQQFKNVLHMEEKPPGAVNVLIRDMKSGLKVQKKAAQKDFLEVCMRKKVFPKDIIMIAKHQADFNE